MKLLSVERTEGKPKAFKAVFLRDNGRTITTRFGTSSNFVLNPKITETDKRNYLLRHKVRENWSDFTSAGSLSKHILWETRSLTQNIKRFRIKFNL